MINFKKLLAGTLSAAMVLGTMAIPAFADDAGQTVSLSSGDFIQQRNSVSEYTNSTVTYEIDGKVEIDGSEEWTNVLKTNADGVQNVKNVKFVGKTENAELNIKTGPAILAWQGHALNVEFENLKLSNSDPRYVGDIGHAPNFFTTFLRCGDAENCSVKYTKCNFTNGGCNNQYGKTSFVECSFENSANYALWIYGEYKQADVEISKSSFKGAKGVKVYSERGAGQAFVETKISGCEFNNITDKPAIVSSISGNIEVTDTSFDNCPKGVVENSGKEWNDHTPLANITIDGQEPEYTYTANGNLYTNADYGKAEMEKLKNGGYLQIPNPGTPNVKTENAAFTTLVDALTYVYKNGPYSEPVTIECKANADVGAMTHGHVADDIIINGNGAYVSGDEYDLEFDTFKFDRTTGAQAADGEFLTKDVNVVVNNLNGIAAWGQRNTNNKVNITFNNCKNMNRVYISGTSGVNNFTLNNCTFEGLDPRTSVYSNAAGTINLIGCDFSNVALAVNCNNKSNGAQKINIDNCTFTDCATGTQASAWSTFAAPIRVVTSGEGAKTDVTVENADISYTGTNANVGNGDILLGAKVTSNPNVTLNIKGTAAEVQTQYHDKDAVTTRIKETESRTLKMTSAPAKVKAVFEESTDEVENGKAYDLYIEADGEIINRLTSAHFTFALETKSGAIEYAVKGADNVSVTGDVNNVNRYLFNFDGTKADATDRRIKLGQIVFTGVGTFDFKITTDDNAENVVNATELVDNIVKSYVAAASADDTLDLGNGITDGEIKQETANLTVNVSFPNAIEDNAVAYQNMKVTVSGNGVNKEFKLGTGDDGVALNNDKYTVNIENELVKNNTYTVTVSGAGYRTARYTVSMTGNKELNFWNNVKTAPMVIEKDSTGTGVNTNFLAGDIVKDGQINIYDLSAVVSYFGTDGLSVSNHPEYAKYDLNRDGVIDSKDVAYVLVSWGK